MKQMLCCGIWIMDGPDAEVGHLCTCRTVQKKRFKDEFRRLTKTEIAE